MDGKNFGISDDERKGVLLGSLVSAAIHGFSGKNPVVGGAFAYGKGVGSIYDQKKAELDAERMNELINASKISSDIAQSRLGLEERRVDLDEAFKNYTMSKPWGTIEVGAGDGKMQKGTYDAEGFHPMGEKYRQFNPNTGAGADAGKEYRQWVSVAMRNAFRGMKFNDPNQLALINMMIQNPDKASEYSAALERSMTPEQKQQYAEAVGQFMETYAPAGVLNEFRSNTGRVEAKVIDGKRYIKKDGRWYVE